MDEKKDIELIDRYLKNELSIQGREDFNARLEKDLVFNDLYQFINNLRIVAKVKGREEIREFIGEVLRETTVVEQNSTKKRIIRVPDLKSYFEIIRLRPIIAIAASVIGLTISSIILVMLFWKPTNTNNVAIKELDKEPRNKSRVDSIINFSKSHDTYQIIPKNIISKEFGFAKIESTKPSTLLVKILADKGTSSKYILYSDTLILLGSFDKSNIKSIFNFPRFYVMNYSEKYYRLKKVDKTILPVAEETDSDIIKTILKPQ